MVKHKNSEKVKSAGKNLATSKNKKIKHKSSSTLNNHKNKYHK